MQVGQTQNRATPKAPERHSPGFDAVHTERLAALAAADEPVVAFAFDYPASHDVPPHRHSRAQLLHACRGVVLVSSAAGRWMIPPDHAVWIPAGVEHAVTMLGPVRMQSLYVLPEMAGGGAGVLKVVGLTDLMRSLMSEAVEMSAAMAASERGALLFKLLLAEIPRQAERPLGLPFPAEPRLAALCRRFMEDPSPDVTIDSWAGETGMSRRSFTRAFKRETGVSLSIWRQQASLFAALPRLAAGETVTSVALDLGYENVPAFTTMFKRMLGTPPRSYFRDGAGGVPPV